MNIKNIKYNESIYSLIKGFNEFLNNLTFHKKETTKELALSAICAKLTDMQMEYDQISKHDYSFEKHLFDQSNNELYSFLTGDLWLNTYAIKIYESLISSKIN